jgi:hypothetical protein
VAETTVAETTVAEVMAELAALEDPWASGGAGCSYGNQLSEVGERVAQMLRRERRESDELSDGVRAC